MRAFAAAARLELAALRADPGDLLALVTAPLFTVAFLAITRYAGRTDLTGYAVLAPAVLAVLGMAILTSGEVVSRDRFTGTLEMALASPTPLPVIVLGRIATVTAVSQVAVAESWLVAWLGFGVTVPIAHPGLFAVTLCAAAIAMAGTATLMSAVFVATRSARTFQNSLSYPLFLLGGALVPVSLLPGWLQPLSRVVFVSWATDLLRDSLAAPPVPYLAARLGIVLGLGALGYAAGAHLLLRMVDRARATGRLEQA